MGCPRGDEHHRTLPGRKKKLLAGVRFSLLISGKESGQWECCHCPEAKRSSRNCRNKVKVKHELLQGKTEWLSISSSLQHVLKIDDLKYFSCPVGSITPRTWQIMKLVNETTSSENCDIIHLPFPGTLLEQPVWFRQAVQIVRSERASHRAKEMENLKNGRSKS